MYYVNNNNVQAILHHAFKTNDQDFCGELLQNYADSVVKAGQFEWLLEKKLIVFQPMKKNEIL